jgi:hypothetical protein
MAFSMPSMARALPGKYLFSVPDSDQFTESGLMLAYCFESWVSFLSINLIETRLYTSFISITPSMAEIFSPTGAFAATIFAAQGVM